MICYKFTNLLYLSGVTLSIKEKLKEWKLLKTKEDYEFFTDIVRNGREQDAKIYIDSLEDKSRKIIAADTYFTILRTYLSLIKNNLNVQLMEQTLLVVNLPRISRKN